jgi:hypothetical protein
MTWVPFDGGESIGQRGSERGIIIRDELHHDGARITLERDGPVAPYATTCGIYGWIVHTRFFDAEDEVQSEFQRMRHEISKILSAIPLNASQDVAEKMEAVVLLIRDFVDMFP